MVAALNTYFLKVLLINSINSQNSFLKNSIFVLLLLLEYYEQGALQKELIIAPLMELFKATTFGKSYWNLKQ